RDDLVTGVQTCALPISSSRAGLAEYQAWRRAYSVEHPGAGRDEVKEAWRMHKAAQGGPAPGSRRSKPTKGLRHCAQFKEVATKRSEERRVGKGCGEESR